MSRRLFYSGMITVFKNIKQLVQVRDVAPTILRGNEMKTLPIIENAFLVLQDELIHAYGKMEDYQAPKEPFQEMDATGRLILPCWIDSHTHLVYAGNRIQEFVDRINGLSYEEIAARGGGILQSAARLGETSEEILFKAAEKRLCEVIQMGTGAIEIKSGYGLNTNAEMKMLRVIKALKQKYDLPIKSTFLGAHAFPKGMADKPDSYVDLICNEMIPQIAEEKLADYVDAFLEKNYFNTKQVQRVVETGKKYGLIPKIHVNQFNAFGGIKACVEMGALSVDHLEVITEEDITALQNSKTIPVALPACSYFIQIPYTPARQLLNANLPLALASDYNPGTSPTGNMNFIVSSACIQMKMTPEEAINAATINAAYALNLESTHGSISKGKKANIMLTHPLENYNEIAYAFGNMPIAKVWINGILQNL